MSVPFFNLKCEDLKTEVFKRTNQYIYFSDDDDVRFEDTIKVESKEDFISIPEPDIEQTVSALCLLKEGKSCAVYSPFYESRYSPYPMIISAVYLLSNTTYSYLVIGGKKEWEVVLNNVYRHGNIGNHPLMKYYRFKDILKSNSLNPDTTRRKQSYRVRWLLSSFYQDDLWDQLEDIALIIVDLTSGNSPRFDKTGIEGIMNYSSNSSIPAVFFLKNPLDSISRYLKESGVELVTPKIEMKDIQPHETPTVPIPNSSNYELNSFLKQYDLRSYKISKNGIKKKIEIIYIEDQDKFRELYNKFNNFLSSLNINRDDSYVKYVKSLGRSLLNEAMEFTGAVNTNTSVKFEWLTHPLGTSRDRFNDAIWMLNEEATESAKEVIDVIDSIMREFESKVTPKGTNLAVTVNAFLNENKTVRVLGKRDALSPFLQHVLPYDSQYIQNMIVPPDQLESADPADILIFLNPVCGRESMKLLTSCAEKLIIINYPWEKKNTLCSTEKIRKLIEIKDSDENFIEVKDSGDISSNQPVNEQYSEIKKENVPSIPQFYDFDDDLPDNEEEEEENFIDFAAVFGKDGDYTVQKWIVPIQNREVIMPGNRQIVLIKDNETYTGIPSQLKPGDVILISKDFNPKSLSDFVWEIMEKKYGIRRKTHPGNQWREKLKEYIFKHPGITYPQILEKLNENGNIGISTAAAIYLWLESDTIIGPFSNGTLEAIASLVGSKEKINEWKRGIQEIRQKHRRLSIYIGYLSRYNATNLKEKNNEDDIVVPELNIRLSELSKLVQFASVTGYPRKM